MMGMVPDFPVPNRLDLPVGPYSVKGYAFGERVRSRIILWARHLGEDVLCGAGVPVKAIGDGQVVWAEMRPGSEAKRNWGGLVVVGHTHKEDGQPFFSVYGHITDLQVRRGDRVRAGERLGVVAEGATPENGWWKKPHLHFGIYTGPWMDEVLPGYVRPFQGRTKYRWWRPPQTFIEEYNAGNQ